MDMTAKIELSGPLLKGKGPEIIQQNLVAAMDEVTMRLWREIQILTPLGNSGSSGLRGSIQVEVKPRGGPVRMGTPIVGIIGTPLVYGQVVEMGRRAGKGKPPVKALREWVAYRLGLSGEELERATYAVRNKIAVEGTKGVHMFERAFNENLSDIQAIFGRYGFQIAQELNR